jgi:hypothetical protein
MTPREAYIISRDVPAAHKGGFAVAQMFPQPLVDCYSSVDAIQCIQSVTGPSAALGLYAGKALRAGTSLPIYFLRGAEA